MVAVVKTFNYTGTLQQATIPAGTTSMDVHLWGGAGGGGGSDAGGPGGTGAAGHYVTSSTISISSAQIGTTHWKSQWAVAEQAARQVAEHPEAPTEKARQDIQVEKVETLDHNHTQVRVEVAEEPP